MNKLFSLMLIFFFISGSFVGVFGSASASRLVENIWVPKTPMSQTRFSLGVVAVDDKIYAIGGFTQSGYLGTNEQYDPATDTWTTLASMPTPRNEFAIAACQGKIYCIGGMTSKEGGGWYRCGINEVMM
jgi:GH43 family beta-xylosidase